MPEVRPLWRQRAALMAMSTGLCFVGRGVVRPVTTVEGAREGCGDGWSFSLLRLAGRSGERKHLPNTMRVGAAILLIAAATPTVNIVPCGAVISRWRTKR